MQRFLSGLILTLFPLFAIQAEVKILRVAPQGMQVQNQKQISITFNQNMVELGDMNPDTKSIPVEIEPAVNCSWRWVDVRNLACELNYGEKLTLATNYKITVKKELKSHKGDGIGSDQVFLFSTLAPKVHRVALVDYSRWNSPVRPKVAIQFNMNVSAKEIEKHVTVEQGDKKRFKLDQTANRYSSSYWTIEVDEDLVRDERFEVKVAAGIMPEEGTILSSQEVREAMRTPPHFKIEQIQCLNKSGTSTFYESALNQTINAIEGSDYCEPHLNKTLKFTIKVVPKDVYQQIVVSPDPTQGNEDINPFQDLYDYNGTYNVDKVQLPRVLKSKTSYKFDLSKVENIFGEKLQGPNSFEIVFGLRSPSVRSQYAHAVIEKGIGNDIPVLITNLPTFNVTYDTWTSEGLKENLKRSVTNEAPEDVSYFVPVGLESMLDQRSGVAIYRIDEEEIKYEYPKRFNQASPYQIYAKLGHYNSLVWVLDLQTGQPIADANVRVVNWGGKDELMKGSKTDGNGLSKLPGLTETQIGYSLFETHSNKPETFNYVTVEKDGEFATLPITWSHLTRDNYDYDHYSGYSNFTSQKHGHLISWGTTPQGVYRAGSEIDYKIYVRLEELKNLAIPPSELLYSLAVIDPVGKTIFTKTNMKLSEFGTLAGSFKTSKNATVGDYEFQLAVSGSGFRRKVMKPMKVLVSDFTPAPFQMGVDVNKRLFRYGDSVDVIARASLHSGGPHTGTEGRVSVKFIPSSFSPKIDKYKRLSFSGNNSNYDYQAKMLTQQSSELDKEGEKHASVVVRETHSYGKLYIEAAAKDDRGKFVATSTSAEYFGKNRYFGARASKWIYKANDEIELDFVVLDPESLPIKDEEVKVTFERHEVNSVKVKGSGNAYVTRNDYKWIEESVCIKKTTDGTSNCTHKPKGGGRYRIKAFLAGDEVFEASVYVQGTEGMWWGDHNTDQLALDVEKTDLSVDETIEVLIKNPYPEAKALITVERYGILDQWVVDVKSSAHVFNLKVKPEYIPGFYLSVDLFSPRVKAKSGFGELDLGKPSYRTGYKVFKVNDPYKRIDVSIKSDKERYVPNDEVTLSFEAKARNGKLDDVELAVAVLDEAVFDLIKGGEKYFDAYEGLAHLGALDVKTYNLIKMLIGRQKFEKKGANQGGGGGFDVRSNINFLAFWDPSVILKDGKGRVKFKLPDNLTGWKVIVMSADKKDRLGLDTSKFVSRLPTEIRPALPNYLVEGDSFKARFTIMNREAVKRKIDVVLAASGIATGNLEKKMSFDLNPNEKKYAEIELKVGKIEERKSIKDDYVSFVVKAGDKLHTDTFLKQIPVVKRRPGYWAAQYEVLADTNKSEIDIKFPKDIYPDVGGIEVVGSTTLIGFIEEGFKYLKGYPYGCWEQRLTKGLAAAQYLKLKPYFQDQLEWQDAHQVVEKMLVDIADFQLQNGAMSYYGKYSSEYLSAYTGLALSWLKDYGYKVNDAVENKLVSYLQDLLRRDLFDSWNTNQTKLTIRAVAIAALARLKSLPKDELARYETQIGEMDQFGRAHYFLGSLTGEEKFSKSALELILGSLIVDSGSVRFNENINTAFYRLHYSPKRTQCAVLMSVSDAYKAKRNQDLLGDFPAKLARTITKDMQVRGDFWGTTQDSIYCMNALISYAMAFESVKPNLTLEVKLGDKKLGMEKFTDYKLAGKVIRHELEDSDIGKSQKLVVTKGGKGTAYYKTTISFSPKNKNVEINNGIAVKKVMNVKRNGVWEEIKPETILKRGELVAVDLMINMPTGRHFVVVDDPIAAGLEPVNTDLATASQIDEEDNARATTLIHRLWNINDWFWYGGSRESFYHQELRNDRALFYSTFLPPGDYYLGYKAQVVATGEFASMPVKAQEMYNPEVFGALTEQRLKIEE